MAYWSMVIVLVIGLALASGLGGVLAGPPMVGEMIAIGLAALTATAMLVGRLRPRAV
jgi:hypothetical protein